MNDINELQEAIKTGDSDKIKALLDANPTLAGAKTDQGISPLQLAAYYRHAAAVEILRKHKKELDVFEAASVGDGERVGKLLDQNPELTNSFSIDGFTPLGLAAFFGNSAIVKLLLDKGANPTIAANNPFKVTPLHSACATSNYEITELLIKRGADVNAKQMQGVTPLHSAAHLGQTELVKLLIEYGADVNAKMEDGQTPLYMAEEKGFDETARAIKRGERKS